MDTPVVRQLFRQLYRSHPACQSHSRRNLAQLADTLRNARLQQSYQHGQTRTLTDRVRGSSKKEGKSESKWQQRSTLLQKDMSEEYKMYPMVTATELRQRKERPKRVKMLMRDFIEDSLYNCHYGYFSQQAVIFTPGEPFDFPSLPDEPSFHKVLAQRYSDFEDKLDEKEADGPSDTRQLWYTPTELFRPFYGEAIARYLLANYRLRRNFPYHDLIAYEMGAGNGTLMLNILDYLRDVDQSVYERTKFKIIEVSSQLARLQQSQLLTNAAGKGHADKVQVINTSIFDWQQAVPAPCFFLAFEVMDNFAHDVVRYELESERPLQGVVLIDGNGDFFEFYTPNLDPVVQRFLVARRAATRNKHPLPYPSSRLGRWLAANRPLAPNLSEPEYLPTRLMQFFDVLDDYFPNHQLLTSDFHVLPATLRGLNAPVVQTRFNRVPVPVSTPLVHQGFFDIMFPTDFGVSEALYRSITGKLTQVLSHEEFMHRWAYIEETETQSGESPMLTWYKNASVMMTV